MKVLKLVLFLMVMSFFFAYFSFAEESQNAVDSTRKDITVTQLKEQIKNDSNLVILDVRTKEELTGKLPKIESAINIPLQQLEKRIYELEPYRDRKIAVICRSGQRSSSAYIILKKYGYNVENVLGGMKAYLGKQDSLIK